MRRDDHGLDHEEREEGRRRCDPGLDHERDLTVGPEHTATALGSGDVPALATPAILALAEAACVGAVAGDLDEHETTVGTFAEVEHLRATPIGATVRALATLVGHHGDRLEFSVTVEQDGEPVARVRHRRSLVERERFLSGLAKRAGAQGPQTP